MRRSMFREAQISELEVGDETSFRHVGLYSDLKEVVRRLELRFLVPKDPLSFDRALLLNLAFWDPGTSDVLVDDTIDADVVTHVAWHALADRHLASSAVAHVLGEAIASAFDMYLVGRLLGHSPDSEFLAGQVPRMAEVAEAAGMTGEAFESLLEDVARAPEVAFEEVRQLLFDAGTALLNEHTPVGAARVLAGLDGRKFAPLLHHFELTTWVLRGRLDAAKDVEGSGQDARELDAKLRAAPDAIAFLEDSWVRHAALAPPLAARGGT